MSVMGELARYLDALLDELERSRDPGSESLQKALRATRPADLAAVSPSAERILQALDEARRTGPLSRERPESAPELHEAASTLTKLCRIVLGR